MVKRVQSMERSWSSILPNWQMSPLGPIEIWSIVMLSIHSVTSLNQIATCILNVARFSGSGITISEIPRRNYQSKLSLTCCVLTALYSNYANYLSLSVGWESLAVNRTLPDNRGTKEEMNQALKDGEKLGNAVNTLRGLNCTVGDQPASTFVQLTQEQLAELDGNPENLTALDHLNTTINDANDASCRGWKDQKTFVKESRKAYNDISSAEPSENMEGRSVPSLLSLVVILG